MKSKLASESLQSALILSIIVLSMITFGFTMIMLILFGSIVKDDSNVNYTTIRELPDCPAEHIF